MCRDGNFQVSCGPALNGGCPSGERTIKSHLKFQNSNSARYRFSHSADSTSQVMPANVQRLDLGHRLVAGRLVAGHPGSYSAHLRTTRQKRTEAIRGAELGD